VSAPSTTIDLNASALLIAPRNADPGTGRGLSPSMPWHVLARTPVQLWPCAMIPPCRMPAADLTRGRHGLCSGRLAVTELVDQQARNSSVPSSFPTHESRRPPRRTARHPARRSKARATTPVCAGELHSNSPVSARSCGDFVLSWESPGEHEPARSRRRAPARPWRCLRWHAPAFFLVHRVPRLQIRPCSAQGFRSSSIFALPAKLIESFWPIGLSVLGAPSRRDR